MPLDNILTWGFRTSFVRYIEGDPAGQILTSGGATREKDQFVFPGAPSPQVTDEWRFSGTVAFLAHFGMLSLRLEDLRIALRATSASLSVNDEELPAGRRVILDLSGLHTLGGVTSFESALLTAEGAELFLDSYRPGTPFETPSIVRTHRRQETLQ